MFRLLLATCPKLRFLIINCEPILPKVMASSLLIVNLIPSWMDVYKQNSIQFMQFVCGWNNPVANKPVHTIHINFRKWKNWSNSWIILNVSIVFSRWGLLIQHAKYHCTWVIWFSKVVNCRMIKKLDVQENSNNSQSEVYF